MNRVSSYGPPPAGMHTGEPRHEPVGGTPAVTGQSASDDDLNILQKRPSGGEDSLNLHAIWTSVSRYAPASSSRQSYREKMATAYITSSFAANRAPKNVNASLWTDMDRNLSALLRPVVRPNGSEIEIPHSMIAKSRLNVHPRDDIQDMIHAVDDDATRLMLTKIYHHPLSENVGARSDLLRHLCGMLDPGKVNVYMDIDDMTRALTSEVLKLKKYRHLSFSDISAMPGRERAKLLITAIGDDGLFKKMQNKTITVAPKILSKGHLTLGAENSMQAQVPRHKQGERVARHMLMAMDSGVYTGKSLPRSLRQKPSEFRQDERWGYEVPLKVLSGLTKLATIAPDQANSQGFYADYLAKLGKMSRDDQASAQPALIDHFRFSESVRQSQGELQHAMDALVDATKDEALPAAEKERLFSKIAARHLVFSHCIQLIEATVNVSTYLAQLGSHAKEKADGKIPEFNNLFWNVAGNFPYVDTTDSWKGELKIDCEVPDQAYEVKQADLAEAFSDIRAMVLNRLGGGYQV
ncbi:hypothetical protein ACW9H6_04435 [Pseudomonas sp. SDO528_S397]